MRPLPALWTAPSDTHLADRAQPNRAAGSRCTSVYARLVQVPTSNPWNAHLPSAAGEVISPLEKKKRLAQASLSAPPGKEKERPSVIRCSQSPAQAASSHNCASSDGSPVPLSPLSSRSPSPYSVSSEDGAAESGDKAGPQSPERPADSGEDKPVCREESKPSSCAETFKKGKDHSRSTASAKDSTWKANHKMNTKYVPHIPMHPSSTVTFDWAPTSSFTKVIPKSLQPLRPAPIRPPYKSHQSRLAQQDDCLACTTKLISPWHFQMEKRDKSRTLLQKAPAAQHGLPHPAAGRPQSCVLSSYDKTGRDSQQQSILVYPSVLPNRMRLAAAQPLYHHGPLGLAQSALYPHPYTIPQFNPQIRYFSPNMSPIFPHNL